ncbi:MAG TPA: hypothetical protein VJ827_10910 [Rubrobacter sp.]|nr:hypothetical protein [Rubrobacter sp.]
MLGAKGRERVRLQEGEPVVERPQLPWNRLILDEEHAAELLDKPRPKFRSLAASGEFVRIPYGERSYRYYAYDLLDWALARRTI